MEIFNNSKIKIITTSFPMDKYLSILREVSDLPHASEEDYISNLSEVDYTKMIILSVHKFLSGELSLDELSDVGNRVMFFYTKRKDRRTEVLETLIAIAEFTYHVRIPDLKTFIRFHKRVMDFYDKNKIIYPWTLKVPQTPSFD